MSGILAALAGIKTAIATAVDEYFNRTTLLLNTSSTNGAQNNTFLDSSTNNFTITRNGNTTQGTFTPFSQTGWSNYFNGTSDYLTIGTGVTFGSGAFTIECWFNANAFGNYYTIVGNGGSNSLTLSVDSATSVKIDQVNVGSDTYTVSSISLNAWHHLAVVRDGSNNMTVFVDGVRASTGSTTVTKNYSVSTKAIGYVAGGDYWHGYISNLRCVVGTAVYSPTSSTLTVPTTPLTAIANTALLACQSNRFVDNSTNAYSLTPSGTPSVQAFSPFAPTAAYDAAVVGGSGYFDGSGDYLSLADNAAFAVPGQYTIEFWAYVITTPTSYASFYCGSGSGALQIGYDTGSGGVFGICRSAQAWELTTAAFALNQWVHVAITRDASNVSRIFYNGVLQTSATITTSYAQASVAIGSNNSTGYINGYISNFRYLKGTALYTAAFTPPTAPLTAITNTQLLLNHTNAGIYDSAAKNVLETVGNAQVSTTQAKWGTTSISLDGTGDWLLLPSSQNVAFATGDFTIEFWYYTSTTSGFRGLFSTSTTDSETGTFRAYLNNANTGMTLKIGSTDTNFTQTLTANAWVHIAFVRSSGTLSMYYNGTKNGTTGSITTDILAKPLIIGANFIAGTEPFTGYIDDFRISKYARYTATFTPPTAAFPLL